MLAGLVDGVAVEGRSADVLFQPGVAPFTFSVVCAGDCVDGACFSELVAAEGAVEGTVLVVVVVGWGVAGFTWV